MGQGEATAPARARRINFLRPVHLRAVGQPGPTKRMFAAKLSANGMFIRAPVPLPVGSRVEVFLEARGRVLRFAEATVASVLTREQAQTRGRLPGFGIRFHSLPPRSRALVEELLRLTPERSAAPAPTSRHKPSVPGGAPSRRPGAARRLVAIATVGAAVALGGWAQLSGWLPF